MNERVRRARLRALERREQQPTPPPAVTVAPSNVSATVRASLHSGGRTSEQLRAERLAAIQKRLPSSTPSPNTHVLSPQPKRAQRRLWEELPSLRRECLDTIVENLYDARVFDALHSRLSNDAQLDVLLELMRRQKLDRVSFKAFRKCRFDSLRFDDYSLLSNEMLKSVGHTISLRHLSLRSCPLVTNDGVRHLQFLRRLVSLDLSHNRLTSSCLKHLRTLESLTSLSLASTRIDDTAFEFIAPLTSLLRLDVSRCDRVTNLGALVTLTRLRMLVVAGCERVHDESLVSLASMPQLAALDLSNCPALRGSIVRFLASLRVASSIQALRFDRCDELDASELTHLAAFVSLRMLTLPRHALSDAVVRSLAPLTSLRELDVSHATCLSDAAFERLHELRSLAVVSLASTNVAGAFLRSSLLPFERLRSLDLSHTKFSDQSLALLVIRALHLTTLLLTATKVTDDGVVSLAKLPALKSLSLARTSLTVVGVLFVAKSLRTLESLDLSESEFALSWHDSEGARLGSNDPQLCSVVDGLTARLKVLAINAASLAPVVVPLPQDVDLWDQGGAGPFDGQLGNDVEMGEEDGEEGVPDP